MCSFFFLGKLEMKIGSRYSATFWRLCFGSFFFFLSFNLIIPELPDYISSFGGEDYKGMIIGLFALAAGISRPFSGRLVDVAGRKPVMVIGALVCIALGLAYPFVLNVMGFLLLRFVHGFSTGFNPTGSVAYLADIVPADRRGEAMGLLGMMNNLGFSVGPALGSEVAHVMGVDLMFVTSAGFAVIALLLIMSLPETSKEVEKLSVRHLVVKKEDVYEPQVKFPAFIMFLTIFCFGTVLTLVPDHAKNLGLEKQGYFFTVLTFTSVIVRIWSGRISDRKGRRPVMIFGVITLIIATFLLGAANSVPMLFLSAAICGLATGANSPTLFAWAIDRAKEGKTGRAMATLFIALELGIVAGSFIPALVYDNQAASLPFAFWIGTVMAVVALVALLLSQQAKDSYLKSF